MGSPVPVPVSSGYYSIGGVTSEDLLTRSNQTICEPGFFCVKTEFPLLSDEESIQSINSGIVAFGGGIRFPCSPGIFLNVILT